MHENVNRCLTDASRLLTRGLIMIAMNGSGRQSRSDQGKWEREHSILDLNRSHCTKETRKQLG